ncbi:MAG: 3-deoxy-D-manno-octulosonic acid transferase, partial [Planctomycetota bacterium]
MNWILNALYLVAGLFLLPYWAWKLPRAERYRAGIRQRFGFSPILPGGVMRLWVHCASVGEAAIPRELVSRLARRHPDWQFAFSTNTNTGAARLRELYPDWPVFYMPLDFSPCVQLALQRARPRAVLLVELELWPNFAEACASAGVPMAIVNGRISPNSRRLLRAVSRLWPRLWDAVRVCCARSQADALSFERAGLPADRILNCGMLKCDGLPLEADRERQAELRELFAIEPGQPVLVGGSTHRGEEAVLATSYRTLLRSHRTLRLIVAPRHMERSREVVAAVRGRGLPVVTMTALAGGAAAASNTDVVVLDTIGDLMSCYGLATCAFVGRSLLPPGGGQNVLEPAALGKPVLSGPHTANFSPEMVLL